MMVQLGFFHRTCELAPLNACVRVWVRVRIKLCEKHVWFLGIIHTCEYYPQFKPHVFIFSTHLSALQCIELDMQIQHLLNSFEIASCFQMSYLSDYTKRRKWVNMTRCAWKQRRSSKRGWLDIKKRATTDQTIKIESYDLQENSVAEPVNLLKSTISKISTR